MVLSKRERMLAVASLLVIGALVLNSLVLDPLIARRRQTADEKIELEAKVGEAQNTFDRRRMLERKWKDALSESRGSDADTEGHVTKALNEWSRQTRLTLPSIKPERTTSDQGMKEITFVVAGRGSLEAVASFLYRIETARMPIKITTMQLGSTSESGDDMNLQLRLSALDLSASAPPSEKPSQPRQPETDYEESLL